MARLRGAPLASILLCACATHHGPGTPKKLSVDQGQSRATTLAPPLAGASAAPAPGKGRSATPEAFAAPAAAKLRAAGPAAAAPAGAAAPDSEGAPPEAAENAPARADQGAPPQTTQSRDGEANAPVPPGGGGVPNAGAVPPLAAGDPPPSGGGGRLSAAFGARGGGGAGSSAGSTRASPRAMDLPVMSDVKGGQVDKLLENRLDVTAYRIQISSTGDFEQPIFDRTYDAMKPIDLINEFDNAGVVMDQDAYWVRIALIDLLDREEKFTKPRLYGLDKKRKDD